MQAEEKKIKETIHYVEAIIAGALNLSLEDIHGKLELRTPRVNSNIYNILSV